MNPIWPNSVSCNVNCSDGKQGNSSFRRALEVDSNLHEGYMGLAVTESNMGNLTAAEKALLYTVRRQRSNVD